MRWIAHMFKARLLSCLRQPYSWMFVLVAILLALVPVFRGNNDAPALSVCVVVEDEGSLHERLLDLLQQNSELSILVLSRERALRNLAMDRTQAVFVIRSDYSRRLKNGEFSNTVELYTSPSSSASSALSEPVINSTMMLWIEEAAVRRTREFLLARGYSYTQADEAEQRAQIKNTWENGAPLLIRTNIPKPIPADVNSLPLSDCVRWYGAFSVFYIIAGAGWVLDIGKKSISVRIRQTGAKPFQVMTGALLAPLVLSFAGWLAALALCCALSGAPVVFAVRLLLPMLLYLAATLGATLFMASMIKNTIALMLLAPVVTFINTVLGGLLVTLPDWAAVLETISKILPGRWLNSAAFAAMNGASLPPVGLLVCSAAWLLAGLAMSSLRQKAKP